MRATLVSVGLAASLLGGCAADGDTALPSANRVETSTPRENEEPFRLLIHCGLSYPLEFDERPWLPVDQKLRRTHNPPEGFGGDENYDEGTIRVADQDTLIYRSSAGFEVEYEPTKRRGFGVCR